MFLCGLKKVKVVAVIKYALCEYECEWIKYVF